MGLLASEKIEAVTFDDPAQFLNYIKNHNIRVAILDVAMPGLSGIQLQKQLYRFSPGTKVIIITGRPESEIRTLALTGGAFGFLAKPIDDEAFLSSMRQAPWTLVVLAEHPARCPESPDSRYSRTHDHSSRWHML